MCDLTWNGPYIFMEKNKTFKSNTMKFRKPLMQSLQLLNLDFLFWFTFLPIYANRKMLFLFSSLSSATNKSSICVLKLWKFAKKTRKYYKLSSVKWPNLKFFLISNTQKKNWTLSCFFLQQGAKHSFVIWHNTEWSVC